MRELESSSRGVRGRVLIAGEAPAVARLAARALGQAGYHCEICSSVPEALSALERRGADVVLADFANQALELLGQLRSRYPEIALIVLTSSPSVGSAVAAMRQGAFDYLIKPFDEDELVTIVGRAIEIGLLKDDRRRLRQQLDMASTSSSFVAESAAGKQLLALIRRVAPTDLTVLIEGESGTGKQMIARMLHFWSERSDGPFVTLNWKGPAGTAVGSEPFRDGSAAQAGPAQSIPLEKALGGTLFLDEIAEAGPHLQAELVRTLEQPESAAAATSAAGKPRARVVAATSRSLKSEMDAGRFRADLFFRLSELSVRIPPLRERREDILALARRFLAAHAARTGRRLALTSDAERELLAYSWPGNVRELHNVIERAAVLTSSDFIPSKTLDLRPRAEAEHAERAPTEPKPVERAAVQPEPAAAPTPAPAERGAEPQPAAAAESGTLQQTLDQAARARIKAALEAAGGNRSEAAKALEVDGATLNRLIRRLGL